MARAKISLYVNDRYVGCDGEFLCVSMDTPGMRFHITDPRTRGFEGPYDKELIFPKPLSSYMSFNSKPTAEAQLRWARSKNPIDNFKGTIKIEGDHFKVEYKFGPEKKGKK